VGSYWRPAIFAWTGVNSSSISSDTDIFMSLNHSYIHNGDKVARVLVDYYMYTNLIENSLALFNPPEPFSLGVSYSPNPDDFPDINSTSANDMIQGDSLWSTMLQWQPSRWTDGTLNSTQWYATSRGVETGQGKRTIEDKTTAGLWVSLNSMASLGFAFGDLPVDVYGIARIKFLIEPLFG
jgi:hypothetical protein